MWRTILGIGAGLAGWVLIASMLDIGLRHAIPGYTGAEPVLAFSFTMMIARLAVAVLTSLAAGALVRVIAPSSRIAPWIVGLLLLALFIPVHVGIWPHLPVWYHLFFLATLVPLVVLGARLAKAAMGRRARSARPEATT